MFSIVLFKSISVLPFLRRITLKLGCKSVMYLVSTFLIQMMEEVNYTLTNLLLISVTCPSFSKSEQEMSLFLTYTLLVFVLIHLECCITLLLAHIYYYSHGTNFSLDRNLNSSQFIVQALLLVLASLLMSASHNYCLHQHQCWC